MSERCLVVDDHLLLRILMRDEPPGLFANGPARVCTTGLFYHRLCRATSNPRAEGSLSRQLGSADPWPAAAALRAVAVLPDTVGLASLRELAWPMARLLADGVRLNLLGLEALAASEHYGAELCLAPLNTNPQLLSAAAARGVATRLVGD
ncbi:MAG: hypothetical protein ACRDX8_02075 [Acidimicrobiales bacterium]